MTLIIPEAYVPVFYMAPLSQYLERSVLDKKIFVFFWGISSHKSSISECSRDS